MVDYTIQQPNIAAPIAGIGLAYAQGQRQQEQQDTRQALIGQAQEIFRSGDMDKTAEFAIANPELGKIMFEMGGIRDEAAQQRMTGLAKNLTMSQNPVADLKGYVAQGESQGRDMTHSKNMLQASGGDPEKLKQINEMAWAANDPQGYKSYRTTQPEAPEAAQKQKGEGALVFNPDTGGYSVDPVAKEYLTKKAELKKMEAERTPKGELTFKDISGIQKEITPLIKDTKGIYSAAKSLALLNETSSPTDQLAAIFKFMKSLDPTSVVREGEQQMAQSTGGPADSFVGFANQLQGEGRLTPTAFGNMVDTARNMANSAIDSSNTEINNYLDVYGDTISENTKSKIKNRVPKRMRGSKKDSSYMTDEELLKKYGGIND